MSARLPEGCKDGGEKLGTVREVRDQKGLKQHGWMDEWIDA
jgi:hypothetical protein